MGLITEFPEKLFEVALVLMRTKEIFLFEINRIHEDGFSLIGFGLNPENKIFEDERRESNLKKFRKLTFKDVIIGYITSDLDLQTGELGEQAKRVYKVVDKTFAEFESLEDEHKFLFYRLDYFRKLCEAIIAGKKELEFYIPKTLQEKSLQANARMSNMIEFFPLLQWAKTKFENKSQVQKKHSYYNNDFNNIIEDYQKLLNSESCLQRNDTLLFSSVVLIRDYSDKVSDKIYSVAEGFILEYAKSIGVLFYNPNYIEPLIAGLMLLRKCKNISMTALLSLLVSQAPNTYEVLTSFGKKAWDINNSFAEKTLFYYISAKNIYDNLCYQERKPKMLYEFFANVVDTRIEIDEFIKLFCEADNNTKMCITLLLPKTSERLTQKYGIFVEYLSALNSEDKVIAESYYDRLTEATRVIMESATLSPEETRIQEMATRGGARPTAIQTIFIFRHQTLDYFPIICYNKRYVGFSHEPYHIL